MRPVTGMDPSALLLRPLPVPPPGASTAAGAATPSKAGVAGAASESVVVKARLPTDVVPFAQRSFVYGSSSSSVAVTGALPAKGDAPSTAYDEDEEEPELTLSQMLGLVPAPPAKAAAAAPWRKTKTSASNNKSKKASSNPALLSAIPLPPSLQLALPLPLPLNLAGAASGDLIPSQEDIATMDDEEVQQANNKAAQAGIAAGNPASLFPPLLLHKLPGDAREYDSESEPEDENESKEEKERKAKRKARRRAGPPVTLASAVAAFVPAHLQEAALAGASLLDAEYEDLISKTIKGNNSNKVASRAVSTDNKSSSLPASVNSLVVQGWSGHGLPIPHEPYTAGASTIAGGNLRRTTVQQAAATADAAGLQASHFFASVLTSAADGGSGTHWDALASASGNNDDSLLRGSQTWWSPMAAGDSVPLPAPLHTLVGGSPASGWSSQSMDASGIMARNGGPSVRR
jgi:hypothetical protein